METQGTTVSDNTARYGGGGIYQNASNRVMRLSDAEVTQNRAMLSDGGGIYAKGQLELMGAKVSENSSKSYAGAYVQGKLLMSGTQVTNNSSSNAVESLYASGGVCLCGAGSTLLPTESTGPIIINENTAGEMVGNVFLYGSGDMSVLQVDGSLAEGTSIGVKFVPGSRPIEDFINANKTTPVTSGLKGHGSYSMFTCDDEGYDIGPSRNGEAIFGIPATVTLSAGDGSGAMESLHTVCKGVCELPKSTFAEPAGRMYKGWQVGDATESVEEGAVIDVAGDTTVTAVYHTAWHTLQWRIDTAEDGEEITMATDVRATSDEGALTVGKDKDIMINLAGHTIDRGLAGASAREDGSAIINHGSLMLMGEGTVTGGNTTGDGGGIWNDRCLVIDGLTISGNTAANYGGGIYNGRQLQIENTTISDNTVGSQGGGIFQDGEMLVDETVVVSGNKAGSDNNVYLPMNRTIRVVGTLGEASEIGVTLEDMPIPVRPVTVTAGLPGNGKATAFVSDDARFMSGYNLDGEAILGIIVTVAFDANSASASGNMLNVRLPSGGAWVVPACGFTGVFPSKFAGWAIDGEDALRKPGQRMIVTSDLIMRATWKNADLFAFPSFKTGSLILSGKIGVNFFVDLSMLDEDERDACYITFLVNGREQRDTFDINHTDLETKEYYGFTCYVSAIQMAEPIQATLHYGEGQTVSISYNVERYVKLLTDERSGFDEETVTLAKALADYGHYVQPYLAAANNWRLGEDYVAMNSHFTNSYDYASTVEELAPHAFVSDYEGTKVGSASARMFLDSGTDVEVLLKAREGETLTVDDVTVDAAGKEAIVSETSDGRVSVRLDDVAAYELATPILITCGGKQIVSFSALSYARQVVSDKKNKYSEVEKNAMSSLFYYYKACKSYMEHEPNIG
jgi:hypothetical protein